MVNTQLLPPLYLIILLRCSQSRNRGLLEEPVQSPSTMTMSNISIVMISLMIGVANFGISASANIIKIVQGT